MNRFYSRIWRALFGLFCASILVFSSSSSAAQSQNSASVIIRFADGQIINKQISFSEGAISGLEALRRTGFALEEQAGAVCKVDRTGCPSSDCFCHAKDLTQPLNYWGYYAWNGQQWQYAEQGAAQSQVTNGSVQGWSWGDQTPTQTGKGDPLQAAFDGASYLKGQQQANGGYFNIGSSVDSLLAASALKQSGATWLSSQNKSLLDYIAAQAPYASATSAAARGKLALGLAANDLDPKNYLKHNLVISITQTYNSSTGAYGASNWDQAFAILGLRAAGESVPPLALKTLAERINPDGGWGYSLGFGSEVDNTGLMLQALVAGGASITSTEVISGVAYLRSMQNVDGGFPVDALTPSEDPGASNANSTAFAVQGLLAAHVDPLNLTRSITATNPISYLLSLQMPDGGFKWMASDTSSNVFATQQAIPALSGKAFPFKSNAVGTRKALDWIKTQQQADGSFNGFGAGTTLDALLSWQAAGRNVSDLRSSSGKSVLNYLSQEGPSFAASGPAASGKLILGLVAAGANPRDFAGTNVVISTTASLDPLTGRFGTSSYDQIYAMLGLVAAGETLPSKSADALIGLASSNGGWGFNANDQFTDVDSTALALQALKVAKIPENHAAVQKAFTYLRSQQLPNGGFPGYDGSISASSTALAIQALAAYGYAPNSLAWSKVANKVPSITSLDSALTLHTPIDALLAVQSEQGGFPGFSGPNDPFSTYQAVGGLAGKAFPTTIQQPSYRILLPFIVNPAQN
jgi:prenyltransferase beta subunit